MTVETSERSTIQWKPGKHKASLAHYKLQPARRGAARRHHRHELCRADTDTQQSVCWCDTGRPLPVPRSPFDTTEDLCTDPFERVSHHMRGLPPCHPVRRMVIRGNLDRDDDASPRKPNVTFDLHCMPLCSWRTLSQRHMSKAYKQSLLRCFQRC